MKNISISIVVVLLLMSAVWYFNKGTNQDQEEIALQNISNNVIDESSVVTGTTSVNVTADKLINNKKNNTKKMIAILHTSMGDITVKLNSETTPNTVANFVKLAESGFYNGTKFHRVIKGFMNQGGDPLSKDNASMDRWGTGGPGYQFADEITEGNSNGIGTLAMANSGPNTNGSQFFINVADNSFLNTKHTSFGSVTEGMDVVIAINKVKTGVNDRPETDVIITSITTK